MQIGYVSNPPVKNTTFPLVAVCVSYDYMDTLQFMLPINYRHFERMYILTQRNDKETIAFCSRFENVFVLFYDFKNNGKRFDKFGALNYGLKEAYSAYPSSWYLILDSDIVLPNNFIDLLSQQTLCSNCVYGILRKNIASSSEFMKKPFVFEKIIPRRFKEFLLEGFFMLFKKNVFHRSHDNAGYGDYYFCRDHFDRIGIFVNIMCLHLGLGAKNWMGKRSPL
jgi:hypothetical protein